MRQYLFRDAAAEFAEWASLFSSRIFVKLAAYIDESGRHDKTGQLPGAEQIVVCGWVDWRDNWVKFCSSWEAILNKYGAPYFHFVEWAQASRARCGKAVYSSFDKNPYRDWPLEKLDAFLYELAEIAGKGDKIFVGGFVSTKDFASALKYPEFSKFPRDHDDPYRACLINFFKTFTYEVQLEWPYWNEPVAFFFDKNDDEDWNHAVLEAFSEGRKVDERIAELTFSDSKIYPHLPLQAADMLAYRFRQICGHFLNPDELPNPSKLDSLLLRPQMIKSPPQSMIAPLEIFGGICCHCDMLITLGGKRNKSD